MAIQASGCISLYSYIKPQPRVILYSFHKAVYPYIPTSNRNWKAEHPGQARAVYPYIPTSNRNCHLV